MAKTTHITEATTHIKHAHRGAWKGLVKGLLIGLVVGAGIYMAGIGIAGAGLGQLSTFMASKIGVFSTMNMLNFAAFNGLVFGVSGAANGALQENQERKSEARTRQLESRISELQAERGRSVQFRERTEAFMKAIESQAAAQGTHSGRVVQDILARGPRQQGSFAARIDAERAHIASQEAAI
jgi:hypothetical protein